MSKASNHLPFSSGNWGILITGEGWKIKQDQIGGRNKRGCHFCLF